MTTFAAVRCAALLSLTLSAGCVIGLGKSLHQYSMLDIEKTHNRPSRPVTAEASDKAILGLVFETDYVDAAQDRLLATCPKGELVNVRVRHSTDLGFFAYRRKIRMDAVCLDTPAPPP